MRSGGSGPRRRSIPRAIAWAVCIWVNGIAGIAGLSGMSGCAGSPPAVRQEAVFFPPAPARPRLQYLTSFTRADQVVPRQGALERFVLGDERPTDEIAKPYGLAMHRGKIYVCDTKIGAVIVFDLVGRKFGYLGTEGPERLRKPMNLCVDADGRKYVADVGRAEIVVFGPQDEWLGTLGGQDLTAPVDVAVGGGRLYVCDAQECRIVVLDPVTGRATARFGDKGEGPGQFARPTNLALDAQGNVYVSDTLNGRVQVLSSAGGFIRTFGTPGDRPGNFARPKGLAVDDQGRCFVVDAAYENVQIFDPQGRILAFFGGAGEKPGQLYLPAQVIIDRDNLDLFAQYLEPGFAAEFLVLVTSQYGPNKVSVYAFGTMEEDRRE